MNFVNETDIPAELFRTVLSDEDKLFNSLLARNRYSLGEKGELLPIRSGPDALDDIRRDKTDTDFGVIDEDSFFPRTGTDLIVLGNAVAPRGKGARSMEVRVVAGPYTLSLSVSGERRWVKNGASGQLMPSRARTFDTMPLTYRNSYGGTAVSDMGEVAFYKNPIGKGYYLSEETAENNPLPNIENSASPIVRWNDAPDPAGLAPYPADWGLRFSKAIKFDESNRILGFKPENGLFDKAHPWLSGKKLLPGDTVKLFGMTKSGLFEFVVPQIPYEVLVRLGYSEARLELSIEEILVDVGRRLVDISYRKLFDYTFVPHQKRQTVLTIKKGFVHES